MARLLHVVKAALPSSEGAGGGGGAGGGTGGQPAPLALAEVELWRQYAEQEGAVRVLTWTGLGRTSVAWLPRYALLYKASAGLPHCPVFEHSASSPLSQLQSVLDHHIQFALLTGQGVPLREPPIRQAGGWRGRVAGAPSRAGAPRQHRRH